ncbi:hypothetical protein CA85_41830 [Allorhodopirellula solitaria]|uniref:Uncharacterized protein n=2 Tax=Allorhodopirellula solitaria TaxID=2527987 RepID=A0A5C5X0N5_9BACT|nr:hypothetical protein CA85_41830 [Allorhodopirellula solitaria]
MIEEVDLMIDNARLRDELEPYRDDSIDDPAMARMPLKLENEYLSSILAWERAPALPIRDWFNPPLHIPPPESLADDSLTARLHETIERLHSQSIVLTCTDHLSDRELYRLIYRDILPCCEKKIDGTGNQLEYRCVDDTETWLTYYADAVERRRFQEEHQIELPIARKPRYRRELP